MDKKIILHHLRNPWRVSSEDLRTARLEAADLIEKQCAELERLNSEIDFDAKRLRRLGGLFGLSMPESDEALVFSAGSVLGSIYRSAEKAFRKTEDK